MTFDFIVVGAGSAGCVVTRRLVDAGARVLLLEAGGSDQHLFVTAPAAFSRLFRTRFDWGQWTEPQRELNGRKLYWPHGRVMGGSSAINATIYVRGASTDFDAWGHAWSWPDVLPAFRAIEAFDGGESETRGGRGELPVTARRSTHALTRAFVSAAERAGFARRDSFNDGELDGFGVWECNHAGGERVSAFRAFVFPLLGHPRLTVQGGAQVLKVELHAGRATGVTFLAGGQVRTVRAGGVVVSAGAVRSPQLLMLSGVGPREELKRHGIDVKRDAPGVGRNLQDHLAVPVIFRSKVSTLDSALGPHALTPYLLRREGPLTSNLAEAGGFMRSRVTLDTPDVQFLFGPLYFREHGFRRARGNFFSLGPVLVAPESRGVVTLRSGDPLAFPVVQPDYLRNERDLDALALGVAIAREIARTEPLRQFRGAEELPAHGDVTGHVRAEAQTLYHPAGTCALGESDGSVVSPSLRVHGFENLWVADASVMPRIIRANTNATSMMIGERAAQFMLRDA